MVAHGDLGDCPRGFKVPDILVVDCKGMPLPVHWLPCVDALCANVMDVGAGGAMRLW